MKDNSINIRAIQHFMYCNRRFGLLEINNDWSENAFVVKANILHENVHSGSHKFSSNDIVSRSSVAVYNDDPQYNIFGVTDCVEFVNSLNGVDINGLDGKYNVRLVEYKPRQPKDKTFNESDAIQVFAQKLCADYIWKCDSEGYVYYADTKKRIKLPFKEEYEKYNLLIIDYLSRMREILKTGKIPQKSKDVKCSGCSMLDYCFPKSISYCVQKEINRIDGTE
ncbi:MAG: Dna2/Cas4 domain-containing protein [Clostridiales bacterium]|nr:Dna2/Cas4 domain-containing protein [Clostridiales bacterium]